MQLSDYLLRQAQIKASFKPIRPKFIDGLPEPQVDIHNLQQFNTNFITLFSSDNLNYLKTFLNDTPLYLKLLQNGLATLYRADFQFQKRLFYIFYIYLDSRELNLDCAVNLDQFADDFNVQAMLCGNFQISFTGYALGMAMYRNQNMNNLDKTNYELICTGNVNNYQATLQYDRIMYHYVDIEQFVDKQEKYLSLKKLNQYLDWSNLYHGIEYGKPKDKVLNVLYSPVDIKYWVDDNTRLTKVINNANQTFIASSPSDNLLDWAMYSTNIERKGIDFALMTMNDDTHKTTIYRPFLCGQKVRFAPFNEVSSIYDFTKVKPVDNLFSLKNERV